MKILVCGSRDYTNEKEVRSILSFAMALHGGNITIIQGEAKGADAIAKQWAEDHNIPCISCPADWDTYGKAAGPIRNAYMLGLNPDLVLAFPKDGNLAATKGTKNMVKQATERGIKVIVHGQQERRKSNG